MKKKERLAIQLEIYKKSFSKFWTGLAFRE